MILPTFENVNPSDVFLTVEDELETQVEETTETTEADEIVEEQEEEQEQVEADPLAKATYDSLVEHGIIEQNEKFDGTFEFIDDEISTLPSKLLKTAIAELPEHSQGVLKYIATAGQNLQPEELKQYMREYLNESEVPDVSTLDSARDFVEQHLKASGLRPSAIQAQLDELEEGGELVSEAEKLLASKEKKTDKLVADKAQDNQRLQDEQKQFVTSVNDTLAELKWSKPQQQVVLNTIPKVNQILQTAVKNPKAYIQLVDFLSKFSGQEFNLEDYRKQGESRVTSSIKKNIEKSGFSSVTNKTNSTSGAPEKDLFKNYKIVV